MSDNIEDVVVLLTLLQTNIQYAIRYIQKKTLRDSKHSYEL